MNESLPLIETLIPHQGSMHLLDSVITWDDQHAVCHATSHRRATNPLRTDGRLPALAGIEYAAQAMAVHAGLTGVHDSKPAGGFLVSLADVALHAATLDDMGPVLTIRVNRIAADTTSSMYRFVVGVADCAAVEGRATVILKQQSTP